MITFYDNLVIVSYFILMILIGVYFKRLNKNTSDYFRGGGSMLWWLVGPATFMSFISAVTYTGAAGKAYLTGTLIMVVYFANGLNFFISYLYFSERFRQSRVVTAIELVRLRFGTVNEQFFTWLIVPFGVIHSGVSLYSLCIIVSAVFGMDINITLFTVGISVLIISYIGGSWAIAASDFMQILIMVPVALILAVLTLQYVGGVGAFIDHLPTHHFNWTELENSNILTVWIIATLLKQFFSVNNTNDGYRFLAAKDAKQAKKAALTTAILFFTVSIIWFIPPMAATIIYPNINQVEVLKPLGEKAVEGVYFAMGIKLLPTGMIGVMLCSIFAVTMSALDAALNRNAGIFVRNFYKPILRKNASEKELFRVSHIATIVLGLLIILSGYFFSQIKGMNLFDVTMKMGALISLPFMIPLTLGLLVKNTPKWAGWSTVLLGMSVSYIVEYYVKPEAVMSLFGNVSQLSKMESTDLKFVMLVFANVIFCSAWFLSARFFRNTSSEEYHQSVDEFFVKINTPIDFEKEHGNQGNDIQQFWIMGNMCLVYGTFMTALMVIPNDLTGRLCYLFMGGLMLTIGSVFRYKHKELKAAAL